jgi:hypothetical protein
MSRPRARLLSGLAALALGAAALAPLSAGQQITSSGPVTPVDSWGVGWLARSENPLPQTLWANTTGAELKTLMETIRPVQLSPAGRQALRRVLLSPGRAPDSAGDLVLQRLRLLDEMGESERAIDLRKRFPSASWGQDGEPLEAARNLAAGNTGPACRAVQAKPASDPNWMDMRALCLALAGDFNTAASVAENHVQIAAREAEAPAPVASPTGRATPAPRPTAAPQPDAWLVSAIESMREPTRTRPPGRFGTLFEAALSIHAKLPVPADGMRNAPPDIAAHIVRHGFATPEQKRAALPIAVDGGRLTTEDVLAVLNAPPTPPAAGARPPARPARPNLLAQAIAASANADLDAGAKAAAYAAALKSAENASDFRLSSLALVEEIKKLPKSDATLLQAETFARAALVAGDETQAKDWRALMDRAPADRQDNWAEARIDVMLSFAGVQGVRPAQALERLIATLPPEPATPPATLTPAMRQVAIRRIEVTRALFLYVGSGRDLTPAQRTLLASQRSAGRGVPDAALARAQSALAAEAPAEAALAAIAQLGPDPSALSFSGLADLMSVLSKAGLPGDANAIALEALQVWKAI